MKSLGLERRSMGSGVRGRTGPQLGALNICVALEKFLSFSKVKFLHLQKGFPEVMFVECSSQTVRFNIGFYFKSSVNISFCYDRT